MLHYQIDINEPEGHYLDVRININHHLSSGQTFYLPNWIPGSYMIRDFAKNIVSISAREKNQHIELEQVDKARWRLTRNVDCLQIDYRVYAWDLSVRGAHVDNTHAFFNGTSVFLAVEGFEKVKHHLRVNRPEHPAASDWKVATGMPADAVDEQGFGRYFASNYSEFIDYPFELANFKEIHFEAAGIPHRMVFVEPPENVDWQRIANDVQAICEYEIKFWGDKKPPFEQYVFMTFVLPDGFGGLEHINSTALHCSYKDLPKIEQRGARPNERYRTFLSLCAHEYFHSWNVKRLKPAAFLEPNLSKENYTELLWFFEGITSYYDELVLVRSGVLNEDEYLDLLAKNITRVSSGQGQFKQTLAESSFNAWTKFYKQDENAANAIVSYYTKGALAALYLDFKLREASEQKVTLDHLMRYLWNQFGKNNIGIKGGQVSQACRELTDKNFDDVFKRLYHTTEVIPLEQVFSHWKIKIELIPQEYPLQKGAFVKTAKTVNEQVSLGINGEMTDKGFKVSVVHENSSAYDAGLAPGDVIIAVDQYEVDAQGVDAMIAAKEEGSEICLHYFRRGRLRKTQCQLKPHPVSWCRLSLRDNEYSQNIKSWLLGH